MWEWLIENAAELVGTLRIDPCIGDRDDVVQETMMYLYDSPALAEKIYESKSRSLLYSIIKKVIFRENAKANGMKRDALAHYNTIKEVCTKYDIAMLPENAYKIAGILGKPYSIPYVKRLLIIKKERDNYFDERRGHGRNE